MLFIEIGLYLAFTAMCLSLGTFVPVKRVMGMDKPVRGERAGRWGAARGSMGQREDMRRAGGRPSTRRGRCDVPTTRAAYHPAA